MTRNAYRTLTERAALRDSDSSWHRPAAIALVGLTMLFAPFAADAQGRGRGNQDRSKGDDDRGRASQGIPPGHLPSPGECRVWYDGRPPGQQPKPTTCANARSIVARSGGRVIYGDTRDMRSRDKRDRDDDRNRRDDRNRSDDRNDDRNRGDDRNADRYPDRTYPRTLPDMVWGLGGGQGEYQNQVRQWVGVEPVRVHFADADRNGTPELVTWTDNAGRIVQRWYDDNRDGRADRVELYQNNRVVRVIK